MLDLTNIIELNNLREKILTVQDIMLLYLQQNELLEYEDKTEMLKFIDEHFGDEVLISNISIIQMLIIIKRIIQKIDHNAKKRISKIIMEKIIVSPPNVHTLSHMPIDNIEYVFKTLVKREIIVDNIFKSMLDAKYEKYTVMLSEYIIFLNDNQNTLNDYSENEIRCNELSELNSILKFIFQITSIYEEFNNNKYLIQFITHTYDLLAKVKNITDDNIDCKNIKIKT